MFISLKQELHSYMIKQKAAPFKPQNFIVESDIYVNKSRYKLEMSVLKDPNFGTLDEIKASGKFIVNDSKVFLNSCPHRGGRLKATEEGHVCSYHGWKFDQAGRLTHATGHSCPFPEKALKLQDLDFTEIAEMYMQGKIDTFGEEIRESFQDYNFLEKRVHDVKCNWKFLIESLLETYHFPFAHAPYLEGFENAFYSLHSSNERNARIVVPLSNLEEEVNQSDLAGINIMYFFFPYTFCLFMSSGFVWFRIVPISVNESRMECYLYSHGKEEEAAKKSLAMLNVILDQDFSILEGQQENAMYPQRFHLTGYEGLIKKFHKNISEALPQTLSQ